MLPVFVQRWKVLTLIAKTWQIGINRAPDLRAVSISSMV
jgi:hypothetical protein